MVIWPISSQFTMNLNQHERKILPVIALGAVIIVTAIFSAGAYYMQKLKVNKVAENSYAALVIFVVSCLLVIGLVIYCVIAYGVLQRKLLVIIIAVFTLVIGVLAFAVFNYKENIYNYAGSLWEGDNTDAAKEIEKMMECTGWDEESNATTNCAVAVKEFLDVNANKAAVALGIFFVIFMLAMFFSLWLVYNKREGENLGDSPAELTDIEADKIDSMNGDLDAQLNPEGEGDSQLLY